MTHRKAFALGLILSTLCFGTSVAASASDKQVGTKTERPSRDWSIEFTPYLWLLNADGEIAGGPIDNTFGVGIISLLEDLSGYVMADMTVRYKRVGITGDGMWSRIKTSESRPTVLGSHEIDLQVDLAMGSGVAFYRFRPIEGLSLDPYIGARWWRVGTQLEIVDNGGPLPPHSGEVVTTWADPIFGLKVNYDITEKWRVKAAGDVGGGVSTVSWQALVGGAYQVTDWFALDVSYRVTGVKYEPSGDLIELKLNGLLIGFNFRY